MNELVTAERGILIPAAHTGRQAAAVTWLVDVPGIAAAVERALALEETQYETLGKAARKFFLENDRGFRNRIVAVLSAWLEGANDLPLQSATSQCATELQVQ